MPWLDAITHANQENRVLGEQLKSHPKVKLCELIILPAQNSK